MTKPRCYNRPPFQELYWAPGGESVPHRMTTDCGSWKAPEGEKPYPVLAGWDCEGCRWKPATGVAMNLAVGRINASELKVSTVTHFFSSVSAWAGSYLCRSPAEETAYELDRFWSELGRRW